MDDRSLRSVPTEGRSRFELAPPRRFALPAILLLLSEHAGYGYSLAHRLEDLRFGHVDRPAVYRALAQLEADGLVEGVSDEHGARQARRVYHLTPLGERALRAWMGVIKEEHDQLGQVLRRYQATGTADAALAEIEGGWAATLGYGWSPFTATSDGLRRLALVDAELDLVERTPEAPEPNAEIRSGSRARYELVPERSVVLIDVRSTAGPLSFGSIGVTGHLEAVLADGLVVADLAPEATVAVEMATLSSGNRLYDAELLRRIDGRQFPTAIVRLRRCEQMGSGALYRLEAELTLHGVTRPVQGTVSLEVISERRLLIKGDQVFDIRDFAISSPTVLMLRIYPDVRVRLHAEAELKEAP